MTQQQDEGSAQARKSSAFYVRKNKSNEWVVWGPMGNPEFVGKHSIHSTLEVARAEAERRNYWYSQRAVA